MRKMFIMMTTYYNFEHSTITKVVGSAPGGGNWNSFSL